MTTQTPKATMICPVCGVAQEREASDCTCCGWDFSPMLGSSDQIETLLRERLERARSDWCQQRYNPDLIPELERDPFETAEEFAARLAERPWYVGDGELQKSGYDIESGHFPLRISSQKGWAEDWLKAFGALSLTLPGEQARALYQKGANWPLYGLLTVRGGQVTLESLALVAQEKDLPVLIEASRQAADPGVIIGLDHNSTHLVQPRGHRALAKQVLAHLNPHQPSGFGWIYDQGLIINGRFRDLCNGTVLDIQTGLQWTRYALGQKWDGQSCVGKGKYFLWDDMFVQLDIFNSQGSVGGHSDWRVPSKEELASLILKNCMPPIDQQAFPNTPPAWFWSSTPYAGNTRYAWRVDFHYSGIVEFGSKYNFAFCVRLVRGGQ